MFRFVSNLSHKVMVVFDMPNLNRYNILSMLIFSLKILYGYQYHHIWKVVIHIDYQYALSIYWNPLLGYRFGSHWTSGWGHCFGFITGFYTNTLSADVVTIDRGAGSNCTAMCYSIPTIQHQNNWTISHPDAIHQWVIVLVRYGTVNYTTTQVGKYKIFVRWPLGIYWDSLPVQIGTKETHCLTGDVR